MKKLLLLIPILTFVSISSSAQDVFPLANAKWTGVFQHPISMTEIENTYFSYVLQGDTIVDNSLRSKVYYLPDITKQDSVLIGYIHIQDSIVFYQQHEIQPDEFAEGLYRLCDEYQQDYPLYDFSLKKGEVNVDDCAHNQLIVTDVDIMNLGGRDRKKIIFNNSSYDIWIEGMGHLYGLFSGKELIPTSGDESSDFICFRVNGEVLYLNPRYMDCPSALSSIDNIKNYSLKGIQIYDLKGILVQETSNNSELQTFLLQQSLSSGIYILKITLENGNSVTEKLFIQ
jgi:hypothetical protein